MLIGQMPAPTAAPTVPAERAFRIDTHDWPDYSPEWESGFPYTHIGPLVCRGTDEQFRALVEKFSVDHAMIAMSAGRIEEALSDAVAPTRGNPELARELRERDIRFEDFLAVYTTERGHRFLNSPEAVRSEKGQRALDAAQYRGLPGARELRERIVANGYDALSEGFETGIRHGSVRLADLIAIGAEEAISSPRLFNEILRGIARGEGKATAEEIGALITGMLDIEPYQRPTRHEMWARMAHRYGAHFARGIEHPEAAHLAWNDAMALDDPQAEQSFLAFYHELVAPEGDDRLAALAEPPAPIADALLMWGAGASAAEARAGLASGLTPHQVAAVHGEDVAAAVSDGWL